MGTSTNTPATPGPTGIDAIDRIIRGVVMAFAASLPGRSRGAYLLGSYAEGGVVAMSDIDLLLLFSGALAEEERAGAIDY
ncbi:MAG TPA: nucleotidyltransferase domain-containing protein [Ktedonobacterales bacterium]